MLVWTVDDSMAYANCHVHDDNIRQRMNSMHCRFLLLLNSMDMVHILLFHLNGMCQPDKLKKKKKFRLTKNDHIPISRGYNPQLLTGARLLVIVWLETDFAFASAC